MKNADPAYAVIRLDLNHDESVRTRDSMTVKMVVWTLEEAEAEVKRLNELNGDKGCLYYWQYTRVKQCPSTQKSMPK